VGLGRVAGDDHRGFLVEWGGPASRRGPRVPSGAAAAAHRSAGPRWLRGVFGTGSPPDRRGEPTSPPARTDATVPPPREP
jgi:hypothetical protein